MRRTRFDRWPCPIARATDLMEEGLMEKVLYEERPPRYEYRLTDKGREFWDVLAAMWRWGSDWLWDGEEPPVALVDRDTGREIRPRVVDETTGAPLDVRRTRIRPRKTAESKSGDGP